MVVADTEELLDTHAVVLAFIGLMELLEAVELMVVLEELELLHIG